MILRRYAQLSVTLPPPSPPFATVSLVLSEQRVDDTLCVTVIPAQQPTSLSAITSMTLRSRPAVISTTPFPLLPNLIHVRRCCPSDDYQLARPVIGQGHTHTDAAWATARNRSICPACLHSALLHLLLADPSLVSADGLGRRVGMRAVSRHVVRTCRYTWSTQMLLHISSLCLSLASSPLPPLRSSSRAPYPGWRPLPVSSFL